MTPAQRRRQARMRQAVELREKGWSMRAIAAHLGVAPSTVLLDLKAFDSAVRNETPAVRNPTAESNATNVVQLRRAG